VTCSKEARLPARELNSFSLASVRPSACCAGRRCSSCAAAVEESTALQTSQGGRAGSNKDGWALIFAVLACTTQAQGCKRNQVYTTQNPPQNPALGIRRTHGRL